MHNTKRPAATLWPAGVYCAPGRRPRGERAAVSARRRYAARYDLRRSARAAPRRVPAARAGRCVRAPALAASVAIPCAGRIPYLAIAGESEVSDDRRKSSYTLCIVFFRTARHRTGAAVPLSITQCTFANC
ncbi:hypothetical protein EVAR_84536_1 [Eumeta japonica]|uniref:Uncharacterized protein n=1 Tax=Eumeta variegata TaxID=151549 RepID=A0A4C1UIQ3_EUMVA|nr:hypothetical protein EVAR_84536_1 [Eumeta japonica]